MEPDMQVSPYIEVQARQHCDHIRVTVCKKPPIWDTTTPDVRNYYRRHALWIDSIEKGLTNHAASA